MTSPMQAKNNESNKNLGAIRLLITLGILLVLMVMPVITWSEGWAWASLPVLLGVWAYLFGSHQIYMRNLRGLPMLDPEETGDLPDTLPKVALISPARDEATTLESALRSAASLDYPHLRIIAVNDHSTDATGAIMDRIASEHASVMVIHDPPLQEGWHGKANAIWHAVQQTDPSCEWLLLADADTYYHPSAIQLALTCANEQKADFFTCLPYLTNGSLPEELHLSTRWCGIIRSAVFDKINEPDTPAIGIGAFTLVRRETYLENGGHSAFPGRQPEDTLLARHLKTRGARMGVAWTWEAVRIRLYSGWRETFRRAIRKNRMLAKERITSMLTKSLGWAISKVFPLPLALAASAHMTFDTGLSVPFMAYALLAASVYLVEVRRYQAARYVSAVRIGVPWIHPLGGLMKIWIEIAGVGQIILGKPMTWRGREFHNRITENRGAESD